MSFLTNLQEIRDRARQQIVDGDQGRGPRREAEQLERGLITVLDGRPTLDDQGLIDRQAGRLKTL